MNELQEAMRALPGIDTLLARPGVAALEAHFGPRHLRWAVRRCVASARAAIKRGAPLDLSWVSDEAIEDCARSAIEPELEPVHNGTGILLHTNLGRAPLGTRVQRAVALASAATPLELSLATGRRGQRAPRVLEHLRALCGVEDALVTNNNAAAMLLVLSGLAEGREVIVSRSELVEIGGGFRVPEVIEQSGCRLVEVGTTNRTHLHDYQAAIGPKTAAILKVHRSNFAIEGFTAEVELKELARLASSKGLPLVVDQGTGLLRAASEGTPLAAQPTVDDALEAGASLLCFSGDKLLGGPQCGIVAGEQGRIAALGRHPLMRALRCDKLTLAALAETLALHRLQAYDEIPLHAALRLKLQTLEARAKVLCALLSEQGVESDVAPCEDLVGGGSAPTLGIPGLCVQLVSAQGGALSSALRGGKPALMGVVRDGKVELHLRTLSPQSFPELARAVATALATLDPR